MNSSLIEQPDIALLISKSLGYAIFFAGAFLKIPQIRNIWVAKSVKGLSFSMFFLELIGYTITLSYSFNKEFPLSTYGELIFITIQNIIILTLFFYFNKQIPQLVGFSVVYCVSFYALFSKLIDMNVQAYLQGLTIPIFTISKLPQIWSNYKNSNCGELSQIMVFMQFAGSSIRVLTTLMEVDDQLILLGYLIATFLNFTLFFQTVFYAKRKKSD